MTELDVLRLISGWQKGDPKASHVLMELSYLKIKEFAKASFQNLPDDVNTAFLSMSVTELTHDTYEKLQRIEPNLPVETVRQYYNYLNSSVRNLFIDHYRKQVKTKSGALEKKPLHSAHLQQIAVNSDLEDITQLTLHQQMNEFAKLYPRQSEVIELKYFAQKSHKDIAKILRVSVRTVENDVRFAKAWLKQRLN